MNDERETLEEVVAALRQGLDDDLVAVVLFGSRARGEADETSDWDLLVIARHLPEKIFERHVRLKSLLPPVWRGKTAILAKTPGEFEACLPSLFLDIALDGIVLYDPEEYMSERLKNLRKLIEKKGLHRQQIEKDLVWRWDRFPGFGWSLEWEAAQ